MFIQGVSNGVSRVYPGCILSLYMGVSSCIGVYPGCNRGCIQEMSQQEHQPEARDVDVSDTPQMHHLYTSGYTLNA